jgi:hypothetical protein
MGPALSLTKTDAIASPRTGRDPGARRASARRSSDLLLARMFARLNGVRISGDWGTSKRGSSSERRIRCSIALASRPLAVASCLARKLSSSLSLGDAPAASARSSCRDVSLVRSRVAGRAPTPLTLRLATWAPQFQRASRLLSNRRLRLAAGRRFLVVRLISNGAKWPSGP